MPPGDHEFISCRKELSVCLLISKKIWREDAVNAWLPLNIATSKNGNRIPWNTGNKTESHLGGTRLNTMQH